MDNFLKTFKTLIVPQKIVTDNQVFRLHYNFTVALLLVFAIMLSTKQLFGDPIKCSGDHNLKDDLKKLMESFCWANGTYILDETLQEGVLPGLGNPEGKHELWLKYYQWVVIVFCVQALFFYAPHYLWEAWEGNRVELLVANFGGPLVPDTWTAQNKNRCIDYMLSSKYVHSFYTARFVLCETINFLNVIAQIILTDWLITGNFTFYGITFAFSKDVNPMERVFPKLTKCRFFQFGPGGGLNKIDLQCVLTLNVLNEKLFLVLWVWLFFLLLVSFLALLYRAAVMYFVRLRLYLLEAQVRHLKMKQMKTVVKNLSYGDFFVLYSMGDNMNPVAYSDLVVGIYERLTNGKSVVFDPDV